MRTTWRHLICIALCAAIFASVCTAADGPEATSFATLETYGGDAFYRTFWGTLSYAPLADGTSRVTYQGKEDVFDDSFVGKWLEPSRIHHNSADYPDGGRNYFPNVIGVVYANVLRVEDRKNLIVDFAYNGRNRMNPQAVRDEDGTFFADNRAALEAWGADPVRPAELRGAPGAVYAVLGLPRIVVGPDTRWVMRASDSTNPPILHIMASDCFALSKDGNGYNPPPESYLNTFGRYGEREGLNSTFFHLPGSGKVDIDIQWQMVGPTYRVPFLQEGAPHFQLFVDSDSKSTQHGLKRVVNNNQFVIRDRMREALGSVRPGATYALIDMGSCYTGGVDDGEDIVAYNTYRFEGGWCSREPHSFKSRLRSGVMVELIGESPERRAHFSSLRSLSQGDYEGLSFRFLSNRRVQVVSDTFTWYQVTNQYWNGGTCTNEADTNKIVIGDDVIHLGDKGDWLLAEGSMDFASDAVNSFNRIPAVGDIIRQSPRDERGAFTDDADNGIVRKVSDTEFDLWGWNILPGDTLNHAGKVFTVAKTERQVLKWREYDPVRHAGAHPLFSCHPTRITLDAPIAEPVEEVAFTVASSGLAHLLDGTPVTGRTHYARMPFGHLMYTDASTNYRMHNVDYRGYIRCTGADFKSTTTAALSGTVEAIPILPVEAGHVWTKGKTLRVFDPATGRSTKVKVAEDVNGANTVRIEPAQFDEAYPAGSVVAAMFSLNRTAEFTHCYAVDENGDPSFDNPSEYMPYPLHLRRQIEDDTRYRVRIDGGRIFARRIDSTMPEIEITGRPTLIKGGGSFGASRILNPIIADGKGFVVHDQFFLSLADGFTANLSGVELKGGLFIAGHGHVILDRLKTTPVAETPALFYAIFVTGVGAPVRMLELTGKDGSAGLRIEGAAYPGDALKITLTEWTLHPSEFNPKGFSIMDPAADPGRRKYISINGVGRTGAWNDTP